MNDSEERACRSIQRDRRGPEAQGSNGRYTSKWWCQCGCRMRPDFPGVISPSRFLAIRPDSEAEDSKFRKGRVLGCTPRAEDTSSLVGLRDGKRDRRGIVGREADPLFRGREALDWLVPPLMDVESRQLN